MVAMPLLSKEQRVLIALGGLILFIGFTMLSLAILGAFEHVKIEIFLQHYRSLLGASVAVGVLDIILGLLLLFPHKGRGQLEIRKKSLRFGAPRAPRAPRATCAKSKTMKNASFELNVGARERRGVRVFVYLLLIEKQWNLIVMCVLKVLKTPMY